jgi:outer membrane protein assembly factor BamA
MKHFLVGAMMLMGLCPAMSQHRKSTVRDSVRQAKIKQGKLLFSQVLLPASSPETGFLVGSASAFTFSTNRTDSTLQRSTVPVIAYASVRGSYGFQSNAVFNFRNGFRWLNYIEFNHLVDNYWGTGYAAGASVTQGENTTQFTKENVKWTPKILKQVSPKIYAGVQVDYSKTIILKTNPVMEQDAAYLRYGDRVETAGLGAVTQLDTRDRVVNAWSGFLVEMSWLSFPSRVSTGNGYSVFNIDYRHFKSIGIKKGRVLAWNVKMRLGNGDIPFTELSTLGGSNDIRGYYWGRYRDKRSGTAMIEYRHTFYKPNQSLSRHGVVVWTGAGQIWNHTIELSQTLPVVGAGYRFALQPRLNIRVDAGFGRNSSAFYINLTEAF